ncbi:MAG TPA: CaiF/GrlA family transcriptional regulator [Buttiauxella sp.]|jgi:hypothetical protein
MHKLVTVKGQPQRVIEARQANHHSYLLPKELEGCEEKALYRYIARWSFIQDKYICCDDVAANFGISVRQATNIISMIHRRYSNIISCKLKRIKSGKGNIIKTHLLVTDIKDVTRNKKTARPKNKTKNACDVRVKQLRDSFLYYRGGVQMTDGFGN